MLREKRGFSRRTGAGPQTRLCAVEALRLILFSNLSLLETGQRVT
jgi:hypothetical protein